MTQSAGLQSTIQQSAAAVFAAAVCVAVVWSWMKPTESGAAVADPEEIVRAPKQIETWVAVLRNPVVREKLSMLQSRFELVYMDTFEDPDLGANCGDPSKNDETLLEGPTQYHRFSFRQPNSPATNFYQITFAACLRKDEGYSIREFSHGRVAFKADAGWHFVPTMARSHLELSTLESFLSAPDVTEVLAEILTIGPISQLHVRATEFASDSQTSAHGFVDVLCSFDKEEPPERHRFSVELEVESGQISSAVYQTP